MSALERSQTIVFMRHGVARHNILINNRRPNLEDPALWDPSLILEGRTRVVQAGDAIVQWWQTTQGGETIELIVTSPLTRCIQTAILAFVPGDQYREGTTAPPLLCKQDIREAFGKHYPDKRREKSVLQRYWPAVQFEADMSEYDNDWSPTSRENWDEIRIRLDRFLAWLVTVPQNNIVVVSHGVSIEYLFRTYLPNLLENERRVYNADAFACQCISTHGVFGRLQNGKQIYGQPC